MKTQQQLSRAISAAVVAAALFLGSSSVFAQVKIGDNPTSINAGSALEIESTNKGLMMPRISLASTTTWGLAGTAMAGMHVYNTNTNITSSNVLYPTLVSKTGEYYWDGTGWVAIAPLGKGTAIYTTTQSLPGVLFNFPAGVSGYCNPANFASCGIDLGINGTFDINKPINDVLINLNLGQTMNHVGGTNVELTYLVVMDKTTPNVFESVGAVGFSSNSPGCTFGSVTGIVATQNLAPRTYKYKIYLCGWNNTGNAAAIGIGQAAAAGCGNASDYLSNKVILSISQ